MAAQSGLFYQEPLPIPTDTHSESIETPAVTAYFKVLEFPSGKKHPFQAKMLVKHDNAMLSIPKEY